MTVEQTLIALFGEGKAESYIKIAPDFFEPCLDKDSKAISLEALLMISKQEQWPIEEMVKAWLDTDYVPSTESYPSLTDQEGVSDILNKASGY